MKYTITLEKEDDGQISAHCAELVGCHSCGDTEEEALENIREAIAGYLIVVQEKLSRQPKRFKVVEVLV